MQWETSYKRLPAMYNSNFFLFLMIVTVCFMNCFNKKVIENTTLYLLGFNFKHQIFHITANNRLTQTNLRIKLLIVRLQNSFICTCMNHQSLNYKAGMESRTRFSNINK